MDLMVIVEELGGYVNLLIPVGVSVIIQIVKTLLANRGFKFKNPDTWVWVVLALGFFMAWIDYSMKYYSGFTIGGFVLLAIVYAALCAFAFKLGKIGGKTISLIFGRKKDG